MRNRSCKGFRNLNLECLGGGQIQIISERDPAFPNALRAIPDRPLWLFVGTLNAPAANGKLSLHVQSGNWLALKKMLGQPVDESFSYGRRTIFVLWQGGVPTVISPSQLHPGDRVSVRIRAPRLYSLQQAEQVPAGHVGDHEPNMPS